MSPRPVERGRPKRRGEDGTPEVCGDGRQRPGGYASSPHPHLVTPNRSPTPHLPLGSHVEPGGESSAELAWFP